MMVSDGSGIQSCYFYPNFLPPKLVDFEFPVLGYASLLICVFATFKSSRLSHPADLMHQTLEISISAPHPQPSGAHQATLELLYIYFCWVGPPGVPFTTGTEKPENIGKCQCLTLWHLLVSKSLAPLFDEQSSRVQKLFHVPFPRIQSLHRRLCLLTFSKVLHLAKQFQRTKAYASFTANQYFGNM